MLIKSDLMIKGYNLSPVLRRVIILGPLGLHSQFQVIQYKKAYIYKYANESSMNIKRALKIQELNNWNGQTYTHM